MEKNFYFFFSFLLCVVCLVACVPFYPSMPGAGLDESWVLGLNQAMAQKMIFGEDIVFTLGPYASLYSRAYHPATDRLMLGAALYFGWMFFLAAWLNAKVMPWAARFAYIFVLAVMVYSRDALFFIYPILVVFYIYGRMHRDGATGFAGRRWIDGGILVLLLTPLGLLPLIKGSMWLASLIVMVVIVFFYGTRGKLLPVVATFCVPLLAMGVFWIFAGQPLVALPVYFKWMLPIINDFGQSMSVAGNGREVAAYIFVSIIIMAVIFWGVPGIVLDRFSLVLSVAGMLFLAFKAGFVRHDTHALVTGTMLVLVASSVAALLTPKKSWLLLSLSFFCWWQIDTNYLKTFPGQFLAFFSQNYTQAWDGLYQRIVDPQIFPQKFNARIAELRSASGLPSLAGTVDIYSYDQIHLIASGNNWHPRPIFQSYSVYSKSLAELNQAHLMKPDGPQHVIFRVQPIDGRLPALEDGASWPALLLNYEVQSASADYAHLVRKSSSSGLVDDRRTYISGKYVLNEWVDVPVVGGLNFAKIKIKKTVWGELANFLFKPSELEVQIFLMDGTLKSHRLIVPMAETGFLLSPWVENTEHFSWLFDPRQQAQLHSVKSIKIAPVRYAWQWAEQFEMELLSYHTLAN